MIDVIEHFRQLSSINSLAIWSNFFYSMVFYYRFVASTTALCRVTSSFKAVSKKCKVTALSRWGLSWPDTFNCCLESGDMSFSVMWCLFIMRQLSLMALMCGNSRLFFFKLTQPQESSAYRSKWSNNSDALMMMTKESVLKKSKGVIIYNYITLHRVGWGRSWHRSTTLPSHHVKVTIRQRVQHVITLLLSVNNWG